MSKVSTFFGGRLDAHVGDSTEHRLEQRAANARAAGFIEYRAKDLRKIGPYIAAGEALFERVLGVVLDSTGRRYEAGAVAFYVDAGGADYLTDPLVFLNRPRAGEPQTVAELEQRDAERERRRAEAAQAAADEIRARPRHPLTLADMLGRPLQTPAAAARTILDYGGEIEARDGALVISIAADIPDRESVVDAARVLYACAPTVLAGIGRKSKRPLHELLPDEPVQAR